MPTLLPKSLFLEKYFGLSLNHSSLRAISIGHNKKIEATSHVQLEPRVFGQNNIDSPRLKKALSDLISGGNFPEYVSVTIPEYHSFTRSYDLPKIDSHEISEALEWQVEKIFPIPKSEIYFDWKLLSETETGITILVVAMHKSILDQLIQVFEESGLKAVSFEPSASAVARTIIQDNPSKSTTILIEINPAGSSATLIHDNTASLTITNQFDQTGDQNQIRAALQVTGQSIQSLINYFQKNHTKSTEPIKLLLTGESTSPELAEYIKQNLNLDVEVLNINDVQSQFHQAYAAATTVIQPTNIGESVNLLPDKLRQRYQSLRIRQGVNRRLQPAVLVLLISIAISFANYFFTRSNLQALEQTLILAQSSLPGTNFKQSDVSILNKNSRAINQFFKAKTTPANVIDQVLESIDTSITLRSFTFDSSNKLLTLSGVANDRTTLLDLKFNLESMEDIENVVLPLESLEKPSNIDFTIITTLKQNNE